MVDKVIVENYNVISDNRKRGENMLNNLKIELTDDPLKNILMMAPLLDDAGQNKVFGLICGLLAGTRKEDEPPDRRGAA